MGCIGPLPIRDQKTPPSRPEGPWLDGPFADLPTSKHLQTSFSREDAWRCIKTRLYPTQTFWCLHLHKAVLNHIRLAFNAPYIPLHDRSCPRTARTECRRTVLSWLELLNQVKSVKHPCGCRCSDVQVNFQVEFWQQQSIQEKSFALFVSRPSAPKRSPSKHRMYAPMPEQKEIKSAGGVGVRFYSSELRLCEENHLFV